MYCCRGVRLSAIPRFKSNGGVFIQVAGGGMRLDVVTCALHNHRKSPRDRRLCEDFHGNRPRLKLGFRAEEEGRIEETDPLTSLKTSGSERFIQASRLRQLAEEGARHVSLATSAQSGYRGSPLYLEAARDAARAGRSTRRGLGGCVVIGGPVLLTATLSGAAGRLRLAFPAVTAAQMRASSTASAQKRDTVPEDAAAELKADQPLSGDPGKGPEGPELGDPKPEDPKPEDPKPSRTQQLKKVFKEYGAVGVSFHVCISLLSLGMCYLAISSGIDMAAILFKLGFSESVVRSKMAAGTSTFFLAYAVHKLFAPVRISITLVSVPLIVRYLRNTGLFKPPATPP